MTPNASTLSTILGCSTSEAEEVKYVGLACRQAGPLLVTEKGRLLMYDVEAYSAVCHSLSLFLLCVCVCVNVSSLCSLHVWERKRE